MRRVLIFAVLALSLRSYPALPQQTPATGTIEGVVVRADTEQPIANAQVSLTQTSGLAVPPPGTVVTGGDGGAPTPGAAVNLADSAAAIATVATGADGKFVFKNLKPAAYRVAAAANGFVRQEYGQRALNGSGRPLFVGAGQSIDDAMIRVTPAGTISGRILDENGQPATGAPVQLLRAVYNLVFNLEAKTYQSAGNGVADDGGNYRIFGVTPGRYYLVAGTLTSAANLLGPRSSLARFSVVYYPNASTLDEAGTIEVKAGDEASIDLRLKREASSFHVRGRVINPAPGEYKVFSWEAIDNNAFLDPDFLKPYEQLGKAISVLDSSNPSVDVKLIPAK